MSWHYLRELEGEFLEDICSGGEPLQPLRSKITHAVFYCKGKLMDSYLDSLSGTTFAHLMANPGEEKSMSSAEAFHVRTSVQLEKESDSMALDQDFGEKWQGSFAKYDPATHLLRTHQCSLFEDSTESCVILPRWGLMRDGECWEQQTLEQTTKGTGFGLWRTPSAHEPGVSAERLVPIEGGTPGGMNRHFDKHTGRMAQIGLIQQVKLREMCPTPTMQGLNGGTHSRGALFKRLQLLPTPNARDWKDTDKSGNRKSPGLGVVAHIDKKIEGGQLNPDWVEWLMNWPIKWSDLNGFNKQEFQRWQEASAASIQGIGQMRTMWWDSDPSQTPPGQQPVEQSKQEHSNSLPEMSWDASCERKMERSQQGSDLSLLRKDFYIQKTERKDLQQRMREQTCLDEAQIVPRVSKSVAARVDRLKAIGNGQVPLVAATAWNILSGSIC